MAGEWRERKLADACSSIDYGLTAAAVDADVGPRFLRITDIVSGFINWKAVPHVAADKETTAKYWLHDGDIVLARTGASTGASAYVKNPPPAVFASYLVRLKAKPEFDSRYIAYYLKSDSFWSFIRGVLGDKSAQPNASASTMTQAPLRAPISKEEQRAIARILGTLDDKIELNRRINETLEAMAQALFKSWFVDGEKDAKTAWKEDAIKNIASIGRDALNPGDFPEEQFDHYSIPAFDERRFPAIERGAAIKSNKLIVPPNSILLSKLNPRIPRIWFPCIGKNRRSVCSTEFLVALPRQGVPREWLYGLLSSVEFLKKFTTFVTGTSGSHQRVKPESLLAMSVRIPPQPMMERFAVVAGPIYTRIAQNLLEAQILAATRNSLLPKLISGEIRVLNANSTQLPLRRIAPTI